MTDQKSANLPLAAAPADHPKVKAPKIGVLMSNLGTPDNYDYWSMRRYLGEFLSDRRVIDYSPWLWQPLLQLIILTKRPFSSGAAYKSIWNNEANESPSIFVRKLSNQLGKLFARLVFTIAGWESYGMDSNFSVTGSII